MKSASLVVRTLGSSRRRIFYLVLALLPALFFVFWEAGLRLFHYAGDLDLVLLRQENGVKWYQINRNVARRFFTSDDLTLPEARGEGFAFQKSEKTIRIFCLGESSTAGFPYQYNATFPSLLQDRLSLLFPDRDFEVINVGVSAISSYSVLDFTRELVEYRPDLFLIYMGHNEYYGALGVASTQRMSRQRWLVEMYMAMEKLRLFHLLRNSFQSVSGLFTSTTLTEPNRTLMEQMVGDKIIPLHSALYQNGLDVFEQNLSEILEVIQANKVPVVVGTLVSNLADLEPFESQFAAGFNREPEWKKFVEQAEQAFRRQQWSTALPSYRQAAQLDSMPAMLRYRMGQCYRALGDIDSARQAFASARDLDALRFRAAADFNQTIRRVCAKFKTPVAEIESAFQQRSTDGLIGDELLLEHLHPNFKGYFVMADAFCHAMSTMSGLPLAHSWSWQRDVAEEKLLEISQVTPFDLMIGAERISMLTRRYPFKKEIKITIPIEPEYEKLLIETVHALQRREIGWNQGHYRVADYLMKNKRWAEAEREYRAVIKITPTNFYPYLYLADNLIAQQKPVDAEKTLLIAARLSSRLPYAYAKLGLLYMSQNRPEQAKPQLENATRLFANASDLSSADQAQALYLLAVSMAQTNDLVRAHEEAEKALRLTPQDQRVQQLLQQIRQAQGGG